MAGSSGMDFAKQVFLILSVLGIAWWIGTVMKAEGEDKLKEACHPISIVMDGVGDLSEGLTGFRPKWTVKVKQKLEGGCFYFFSIILFSDNLGEGREATGGVHR